MAAPHAMTVVRLYRLLSLFELLCFFSNQTLFVFCLSVFINTYVATSFLIIVFSVQLHHRHRLLSAASVALMLALMSCCQRYVLSVIMCCVFVLVLFMCVYVCAGVVSSFLIGGYFCRIEGYTVRTIALAHCSRAQRSDLIDKLRTAGAQVNVTDKDANTPVHVACRTGSVETLRALLSNRNQGR